MQAAAKAREALKDLQSTAREEGQAEADGASKAAAAHRLDTQEINKQRDALVGLAAAAKAANKESAFGGRDSMSAHLQDLDQEKQKTDLLNRAHWLGFSSPQQAESWNQQVYQQSIIRNKEARQGYSSPDQYLNYLDQERARMEQQTTAMKARSVAIQESSRAYQDQNTALRQVHESSGTLGTTGSSNIQGYQAALAGLPDRVATRVEFADQDAIHDLATYRQALAGAPAELLTTAKLDTSNLMSEMARLKSAYGHGMQGTVSRGAVGPNQLTTPSVAQMQQGMGDLYRSSAYQQGVAGPGQFTSHGIAQMQQGMSAAYPGSPPAPAQELARFQEIANEIQSRIASGHYAPGAALPSRGALAGEFNVGTGTIDKAIGVLSSAGALNVSRTGTMVPSSGAAGGGGGAASSVVKIAGKEMALADVADIRKALQELSRVIADPKVQISSAQATSALSTIRGAIKETSESYKGLSVRPEGFEKLGGQFAQVQQQAGAAFKDLENKGGESADAIGRKWSTTGSNLMAVFRLMGTNLGSALQDADSSIGGLASRISSVFRGLSSVAGGPGNIFLQLAQAAAASGSQIVSSMGPMLATFTAIIQLLPALVAGFGSLSTVFAAMPETVAAIATAFATLKMAISPVMQALSAYVSVLTAMQSAAANPLQTSMEMASMQNQLANAYYEVAQAAYQAMETQVTDAHAVADAQFSLSQAVVNSANSQVVAAHAVKDAQFEVAQANFSQSIQQVELAMSVAEAQHSLQDAVFATSQAQYQLDIAWQTASEDLANLMIQVNYASVNLRGAQLGLEEAQQNYAQTMANSNATALDRAQAAYQIQAAEEALAQQEQQNKDTETQLADVRKYGSSQVFGVTQAEHALTDAQFAQTEASKQLALTEKEAANAQIQAAHAVEDAVFSLSQAYFEQGQSAITGAHSVSEAQYQLSQSQIQQGEGFITSSHDQKQAAFELQQAIDQMALGLPSVASAEENLATAMYRLGPAARTAVLDLEPLAKWFVTNKQVGQAFFSAMLPSLGRIGTILPPLSAYLVAMAAQLGSLGNQGLTWFERLANSPAWKILTQGAVIVIRNLGEALGHVVDAFTKLAIVATPFTEWLTRGVEKLADDFDRWATNADKGGSNFRRWLVEVRPALHDVAEVIKAIVDGFAIIAGGPMGSGGSLDSLKTFEQLMHELSTTILPSFFTMMHALSSPAMAASLIRLFGALTQLLLVIVETPGFQLGFQLAIRMLTMFLDLLADIAKVRFVGDVIGFIAGSVLALGAAFAIAKFTGVLTLITHLKTLAGWAQTAYGWVRKVLGMGAGEEAAAGGGTPDAIVTSGEQVAETIGTAMKEAGDVVAGTIGAAIRGSGETAAAEQGTAIKEAGETAAAEEGAGSAAGGGGLLAGLGSIASKGFLAILIASVVDQVLKGTKNSQGNWLDNPFGTSSGSGGSGWNSWSAFFKNIAGGRNTTAGAPTPSGTLQPSLLQPSQMSAGWAPAVWDASYQHFQRDFAGPITKFFTTQLPSINAQAGNAINKGWITLNTQWLRYVQNPVSSFLTNTLPGFFTNTIPDAAGQSWNAVWLLFTRGFLNPASNFFTNSVPGWLGQVATALGQTWIQGWQAFDHSLLQPVENFFIGQLDSWLNGAGRGWRNLWDVAWDDFGRSIISNTESFFTKTVPGWFTDLGHDFTNKVASPFSSFFTTTMPKLIEDDFKSSLNWVITNVVNKAIGFVNDVTHVVGVPAIKKVQTLAHGGGVDSVAGTGDEDSVDARLTPGEWIIRKPARMAIDAQMGTGFLPALNAMQGYASGGSVGTAGGNPGGIFGDIGSILGSAGHVIEGLVGGGAKGVEGLLGKGAEALFDKVWSSGVTPLVKGMLGGQSASMTGSVAEAVLNSIKKGVDSALTSTSIGGAGGPAPVGSHPGTSAQVAGWILQALKIAKKPLSWLGGMEVLVSKESGGNPGAENSQTAGSSGEHAEGIAQTIPSTFAAHELPGYTDIWNPVDDLIASVRYIGTEYGSPYNIPGIVSGSYGGYYTGGDVVSAVKRATSSTKDREALLLGSYLATGWNPNWDVSGKRIGAWAIDKAMDPSLRASKAKDPYWAARFMLPVYQKAISKSGWGVLPQDAGLAAYYAERSDEHYPAAEVNMGWGAVLKALGIKTQTSTGPGSASGKPGGESAATLWGVYSQQLNDKVGQERSEFTGLYNDVPKITERVRGKKKKEDALKVGSKAWAQWYAMELILAAQQEKALSAGSTSDWTKLWANVGNPTAMTTAQWSALSTGVTDMERWESGAALPPRSAWAAEKSGKWPKHMPWKVGDIEPSVTSMDKYDNALWKGVRTDLLDIQTLTGEAEKVWKELYGPGGSLVPRTVNGPPTPGPGTPPPGSYSGPPDYTSAILNAAGAGGPRVPAFAGGGSVGNVAGMFAGFQSGGGVPDFSDFTPALQQPGMAVAPRGVSEAGQAGGGATQVGMQVMGDVNVHNPVPERASTSITHEVNRRAFLHGRGIA